MTNRNSRKPFLLALVLTLALLLGGFVNVATVQAAPLQRPLLLNTLRFPH